MFKTILSTISAALLATMPTATLAAGNDFQAHGNLWAAVNETGVRTYINPSQCGGSESNIHGFYSSMGGVLVVCQDNRQQVGVEVEWTDNDLDTLRHEAQHLVQDCIDGRGDQSLLNFFSTREELKDYVTGILTTEQIGGIIKAYSDRGADEKTILLELEAFAVAQNESANTIATAVREICNVR